jgi:hypothetical protein
MSLFDEFLPFPGRLHGAVTRLVVLLAVGLSIAMFSGCSRLRPRPPAQYVYVTAKQTYLRDRVAAVSNRTATLENGQKLEVLEHGRRYFHVKTAQGEEGWISEKSVATQEVFDSFEALQKAHKNDLVVASGLVRDEANLHLKPGRDAELFYLLPENDKLQLLQRATLPRPTPGGAAPIKLSAKGTPAKSGDTPTADAPPPIAWFVTHRDERDGCSPAKSMSTRRIPSPATPKVSESLGRTC